MPHKNIMRIGKGVDLRGYYGYLHILRNFHTCDQAPSLNILTMIPKARVGQDMQLLPIGNGQ